MSFCASKIARTEIANNIVGFMNDDCELNKKSAAFIYEWIMGGKTRTKTNIEIWEIVINKYNPNNYPILFRSCPRINKKYQVQSYTGNIETARKFSQGKGYLCIIDTKKIFKNILRTNDEYGFFPVYDLIRKELLKEKPKFSKSFYDKYCSEDEYIVKTPLSCIYITKWCNKI